MDETAYLEMLRILARKHAVRVREELERTAVSARGRLTTLRHKLAIAERAVRVLDLPVNGSRERAAA